MFLNLVIIKVKNIKKIQLIVVLLVTTVCHSQTTIYSKKGWSGEKPLNSYIKDVDNDFEDFEGEYEYSNNGTVFRIKLIKKTMVPMTGNYGDLFHYEDLIVGEIEYIVQNVNPLVDTMGNIYAEFDNPYDHAIVCRMIIDNNDFGECTDCAPNEIRISASMVDTKRGSTFIFRKTTVNGIPALKIFKRSIAGYVQKNTPVNPPIIPDGEYIFIKVN